MRDGKTVEKDSGKKGVEKNCMYFDVLDCEIHAKLESSQIFKSVLRLNEDLVLSN